MRYSFLLACPFVSIVSHIARYAPSSTDKSSSLRNHNSLNQILSPPLLTGLNLSVSVGVQFAVLVCIN